MVSRRFVSNGPVHIIKMETNLIPISAKELWEVAKGCGIKYRSKIPNDKWKAMLGYLTRREIPYLQATMYYFVYHLNMIALYLQEKPTSLMNDNKWIDNPWITILECVGADS